MRVAILSEYPGYSVTDSGKVKGPRGWLKGVITAKGYTRLCLSISDKQLNVYLHVLVCTAFHGDRPTPRHQVRHLDGTPSNNDQANLIWGTPEENWQDRILHGNDSRGENGSRAKLTWDQVRQIRFDYSTRLITLRKIAVTYGIAKSTVSHIVHRRTWIA